MKTCICALIAFVGIAAGQDPDLQRLLKPLDDADAMTRADACDELGKLGPKGRTAADALLTVAESDEDPNVRKAAMAALIRIEPRGVAQLTRVVALLRSPLADQARVLLMYAGEPAIVPLTAALGHEAPAHRGQAARVLGELQPPAKQAAAVEFATPDLRLRLPPATVRALGKLLADPKTAEDAVVTCARLTHGEGAPLVDAFVALLDDENLRVDAVRALGKTRSKTALPQLQGLLEHTDIEVACEAALALANYGSAARSATPVLIKALSNDELELRARAAEALGAVGGPKALKALVGALTAAPLEAKQGGIAFGAPETWRAAERALIRCGDDARETVELALPTTKGGQRKALERVLAAWTKQGR